MQGNDIISVPVYNRRGVQVASFLISSCDKELLQYTWRLRNRGYIYRKVQGKEIWLHNEIMCPQDGYVVDHINGDKLDNTRDNLRVCTQADNMKNLKLSTSNTTGIKGVGWRSHCNKWRAYIQCDGKFIHLGNFDNKEDAIKARKDAEVKYFGEFARQY